MISVVFSLILAGILFFNASLLEALPGFTTNVGSATIYAIAIFLIFFSGLSFYIAKGLRKGDKNVRIVLLILLAINAVGGITSVVSSQNTLSWINIGLNGIAILYLLLSKKAKRHFT